MNEKNPAYEAYAAAGQARYTAENQVGVASARREASAARLKMIVADIKNATVLGAPCPSALEAAHCVAANQLTLAYADEQAAALRFAEEDAKFAAAKERWEGSAR